MYAIGLIRKQTDRLDIDAWLAYAQANASLEQRIQEMADELEVAKQTIEV